MSILQSVTSGVSSGGIRCLIGGVEKMGKTTFATQAPNSLLIPLEVGYATVTTAKTQQITDYQQFAGFIDNEVIPAVAARTFPYRSIVIDSATALERLIHEDVVKRDSAYKSSGGKKMLSMESSHGGYGKAYNLANEDFDQLLLRFDWLAQCGINIVMTCHVFSAKITDPTAGAYDCWDVLLHSPKNGKTYGKRERVTQWADIHGFIYEPIFVTSGEGGAMSRATSQNKGRVLGLSRTPAYVAGNRFKIVGELPLPTPPDVGAPFDPAKIGWNVMANAIYQTSGIDVFNRGQ